MANKVLLYHISDPLNGTKAAKIDINCGTGHLEVDELDSDDQVLAKGTLEYRENQGRPGHSLQNSDGQATLTLIAGDKKKPGFRFPWAACGGAHEWQIKLNPSVPSDITARSRGGNVKLNLAAMRVTRLLADSGGGSINVEVGNGTTGNNTITAKSGAGNVAVRLPRGASARVYAATGCGKVTVDPRFGKVDKDTYQSANYDSASTKFDVTARSGAGNVSVT